MINKDIRVVLVGVEGSINLGFVARLCKNFGVEKLYLVKPSASIDDEAYRYAMRGREILDKVKILDSMDQLVNEVDLVACTSSVVPIDRDPLRQPMELSEFIELIDKYRSIAVVFGRESTGLTREELRKCHLYVHIEADQDYPVLNLSHAVAITLYEIHKRYSTQKSLETLEKIDKEDLKVLETVISKIVELVYPPNRREDIRASLVRILYKANMTKTEIRLLTRTLSKLASLAQKRLKADLLTYEEDIN
ncbi:MAG: RNA methyltransferase [Sulfolobales archaeon]